MRKFNARFTLAIVLSAFLFIAAWVTGLAAPRSFGSALVVAILSYLFWAVVAPASVLLRAVLAPFDVMYVPPPIVIFVLPAASWARMAWLSVVHCALTAPVIQVVISGIARLPVSSRRWLCGGAIAGAICGVMMVLPAGILPSRVYAVASHAAVIPSAVFRAFGGYVPTADNRGELSYSGWTRLVGLYMDLTIAVFGSVAMLVGYAARRVREWHAPK
ncbi:MAG: hypothetical protein JWO97_391 [Acidobacteria bacterium]|nr:hypothetical protein [Acidobacteriota bacterium]